MQTPATPGIGHNGGPALPELPEILKGNPGWLDEAIDPPEMSAFTKTPLSSLASLRTRGGGPKYAKRGTRIIYTRRWGLEWMFQDVRLSTSDPGPEATAA